jgi:hypothetical protein
MTQYEIRETLQQHSTRARGCVSFTAPNTPHNMLQVIAFEPVTKQRYWQALDAGFIPKKPIAFHLKHIQDSVALSCLNDALIEQRHPLTIGEIGADHSRVLPDVADMGHDCHAIDVYDTSIGRGSQRKPRGSKYKIIEALVGQSHKIIQDAYFDILFSISVIEHVPLSAFTDFLSDHHRILKPGGRGIHLIDFYCNEQGDYGERVYNYIKCLSDFDSSFSLKYSPLDYAFKCSFASNDDLMMHKWNGSVPQLRSMREVHQSCSLLLIFNKHK